MIASLVAAIAASSGAPPSPPADEVEPQRSDAIETRGRNGRAAKKKPMVRETVTHPGQQSRAACGSPTYDSIFEAQDASGLSVDCRGVSTGCSALAPRFSRSCVS